MVELTQALDGLVEQPLVDLPVADLTAAPIYYLQGIT